MLKKIACLMRCKKFFIIKNFLPRTSNGVSKNGFIPPHFARILSKKPKLRLISFELRQSGAGFTLLEMMIAIFVLIVGLTAIIGFLQRAIVSSQITASRLAAAYLAQEGIEMVRNIRDTNWLEGVAWDDGLAQGDWEADFNDASLSSWAERYLKINGGFYNYDSGNDTKFKRKITLQLGLDILAVAVEVNWQERGVPYSLSIQENLYNWR